MFTKPLTWQKIVTAVIWAVVCFAVGKAFSPYWPTSSGFRVCAFVLYFLFCKCMQFFIDSMSKRLKYSARRMSNE